MARCSSLIAAEPVVAVWVIILVAERLEAPEILRRWGEMPAMGSIALQRVEEELVLAFWC